MNVFAFLFSANPCYNFAVCYPPSHKQDLPICFCLPGFTGRFCETNINDCTASACSNHGWYHKCICFVLLCIASKICTVDSYRKLHSCRYIWISLWAVVAVLVEALVFIVIGRSCSEGCGFDSHCWSGSFLRFNSRPIMYGAVGSLTLSWSWTR